jgi:hypothetical protein
MYNTGLSIISILTSITGSFNFGRYVFCIVRGCATRSWRARTYISRIQLHIHNITQHAPKILPIVISASVVSSSHFSLSPSSHFLLCLPPCAATWHTYIISINKVFISIYVKNIQLSI